MLTTLRFGLPAAIALAVVSAPVSAITLTEVTARLDMSTSPSPPTSIEQDPPAEPILDNNPQYIGTNPLGVAWDGSRLYVAGFDNFGSSELPIGLIEVLNPASLTGDVTLGAADFSPAFGQILQDSGRGYTGLDLSGGSLAASFDGGAASSDAIQVFDTADNSLVWDLSASGVMDRAGSGVAFDPGFPGGSAAQGTGVAWTKFESGRRALNDAATGASIWQFDDSIPETLGMQWLSDTPGVGSNFARDMTFDPDTGDVYVRRSNDVDAADRTGDNATDNRRTIVDDASDSGAFVIGRRSSSCPTPRAATC